MRIFSWLLQLCDLNGDSIGRDQLFQYRPQVGIEIVSEVGRGTNVRISLSRRLAA